MHVDKDKYTPSFKLTNLKCPNKGGINNEID